MTRVTVHAVFALVWIAFAIWRHAYPIQYATGIILAGVWVATL